MNEQHRRKIESLVSALCDGVIEPQQLAQLEELLRESAEHRRCYLQYVDMHARLSVHPNLTTGIPLAQSDLLEAAAADGIGCRTKSSPDDDKVVLDLARSSIDGLGNQAAAAAKRRRSASFVRWMSLAALVGAVILGWQFYSQWRDDQSYPVVRQMIGEASIHRPGGTTGAEVGSRLRRGEQLRMGGDDSRAMLEYGDGTKLVVYHDSRIEIPAAGDVHLRLVSGTMEVDAAPQPPDEPLIFATDHARYVVIGTRFRLYRADTASRLELDEGKVRMEHHAGGDSVEVTAGQVAVATAAAAPLDVQPLATGRSKLLLTARKAGEAVVFSPDASLLATSDWQRGLRTWRLGESEPIEHYRAKMGRSSGFAFADEHLIHVAAEKGKSIVTVWQPGDEKAKTISLAGKSARSRAISPDGRYIVESCDDGTHVYQIDLQKVERKKIADLPNKGKAWCLSLSRSATRAAAGFWDGTVRVYNLPHSEAPPEKTSDSIAFETRLRHTPTHIALTDDGNRLVVFTQKDGLLLFDLQSGQQRSLWEAGAATVVCLKFTSNGNRLLAGLNDGTARMWSVPDGLALLVIDAGYVPRDIAWSQEKSLLVTAGGQVKSWACEIPQVESSE